jgi:tRNA threonylcarbamoyl adenosine modification protein YeaZ
MRTLVIDTATDACSVALFEDASLLAGDWRLLGRGHAENLIPMIAALPDRGKASRIAVSLGPGSFTGVRVGIAAARALGFAWGAPVVGYPTLALVAGMARAEVGIEPVAVAMTGGHGEWFVARYDADGVAAMPAAALRPEQATLACRERLVAGNQAAALIEGRGFGQSLPLWPDARSFAFLPSGDLQQSPTPIYGRAPDAKVSSKVVAK